MQATAGAPFETPLGAKGFMMLPLASRRMKIGLFLGAGASVFAGQPATKEIMDRVRKRVQERGNESNRNGNARQRYVEGVVGDQVYVDVEKLYDGIEQILATRNNPNCGPIIGNTSDGTGVSYAGIIDELTRLRSIIREILLESFVVSVDALPSIKKVYDMVLGFMKDGGTEEFQVFTTNYDTVVEEYCHAVNLDLVNGFKSYRHMRGVWDGKWKSSAAKSMHLTKLHGSINWHRDADGKIVDIGGIGQRDADNDIMIAPTEGPKSYAEGPFPALMGRFRREIGELDALLVIGFSYRDKEIAKIIHDRVKNGMALISVSPDAAEDIRRVSDDDVESIGDSRLKVVGSRIVLCEYKIMPDTVPNMRAALDAALAIAQNRARRAR